MADIFRPMLAGEFDPEKAAYPGYASPKLDGIRSLMMNNGTIHVLPMSRSMKVIPNLHIQRLCNHPWLKGLDGELTVGSSTDQNTMQATTSGVMTITGEPDFTYWVFDLWNCPKDPFRLRYQMLQNYQAQLECGFPFVKILDQKLITCYEDLLKYESECLELGYEGVMYRSPDGLYKQGRSTVRQGYLLKLKQFEDAEAEIIGFDEQMRNDNKLVKDELGYAKRSTHKENQTPKGTLGAFVMRNLKDDTIFRCGTGKGLTHELRQHIWDNQHLYLNKIGKYKYQAIGVKDAPRIPIWVGVRDPIDL